MFGVIHQWTLLGLVLSVLEGYYWFSFFIDTGLFRFSISSCVILSDCVFERMGPRLSNMRAVSYSEYSFIILSVSVVSVVMSLFHLWNKKFLSSLFYCYLAWLYAIPFYCSFKRTSFFAFDDFSMLISFFQFYWFLLWALLFLFFCLVRI